MKIIQPDPVTMTFSPDCSGKSQTKRFVLSLKAVRERNEKKWLVSRNLYVKAAIHFIQVIVSLIRLHTLIIMKYSLHKEHKIGQAEASDVQ